MDTVNWRLIDSGEATASYNMALDEALLDGFDPEKSAPVLRVYRWKPAAVSIGRFQDFDDAVLAGRCGERSVPVVRRLSGGGAIYHDDELTYSIVCSMKHLHNSESLIESYRELTSFIFALYRYCGFDPRYACDARDMNNAKRVGEKTPVCFAGVEPYDIIINGKKIGGNAQVRRRGIIFQHGSIPLTLNFAMMNELFGDRDSRLKDITTSLDSENCSINADELKKQAVMRFADVMHARFTEEGTSYEEKFRCAQIEDLRYANHVWTMTRGINPVPGEYLL